MNRDELDEFDLYVSFFGRFVRTWLAVICLVLGLSAHASEFARGRNTPMVLITASIAFSLLGKKV